MNWGQKGPYWLSFSFTFSPRVSWLNAHRFSFSKVVILQAWHLRAEFVPFTKWLILCHDISHLAKVYFFTSLEICFPLWIMYIFAINVQKFLKKKLIKTKMIFPPSSSRFALPSLTRPLRGAVPILYLAQDPHRRRAHNSVHRRTFVEHRRTLQQSTGGNYYYGEAAPAPTQWWGEVHPRHSLSACCALRGWKSVTSPDSRSKTWCCSTMHTSAI